ncbi:MAG: hypothetical protein HY046_03505, partial [Acidobacteria bacterium]|nr:hypothetical protein [Acidobacteriota bacterium]
LALITYRKRGTAAAASEARQLSSSCGNSAEFYSSLGQELLHTGQINAAVAFFQETLQLDPQNEMAQRSLNEVAQVRSAAQCAQPKVAALSTKGNPLGARLSLAVLHYVLNDDLEGGLSQFRDVLHEKELPSALLGGLAEGLKELRGLDFAIREAQRWVAARPNSSGPYVAHANLLLRRGRIDEALVMARHAASLNPQDLMARSIAASALRAQGKFEEAKLEFPAQPGERAAPGGDELNALRKAFEGVEEAVRSCIDPGQRAEENSSSANETSAVASLRTLMVVNLQYAAAYGGYATSLTQFGPAETPSEAAADLIDKVLASGTKNGYNFIYMAGASDEKGKVTSFSILAEPAEPGKSGKRFFFIDQTGVIRYESMGRAHAGSPPIQ